MSGTCQNCGQIWNQEEAEYNNLTNCRDDYYGKYILCPKCNWCSICDEVHREPTTKGAT